MKSIIDEELVRQAISFALPTVRNVIAAHNWGPKGVVIAVKWSRRQHPFVHIMDELGPEGTWEKTWGEGKNFREVALQKLSTALRKGSSSQSVVTDYPWLLEEGDSFYTGAVAEDTGLAVAASGAYGDVDEAISWIVWNLIRMLCLIKIAELRANKINSL